MQKSLILLLIIWLCSGEFNVFSNYSSNRCISIDQATQTTESEEGFCVLDIFTEFSLVNKTNENNFDTYQHYFNFISLLGVMVFMIFFRKSLKELFIRCDKFRHSAEQYSIMVRNIPLVENLEEELRKYFINTLKTIKKREANVKNLREENEKANEEDENDIIQLVDLCYEIKEFEKLNHQKKKFLKKKAALKKNQKGNKDLEAKIEEYLAEIENHLREFEKNKIFCGIAFISFQSAKNKEKIVKENKINWWEFYKKYLILSERSQPQLTTKFYHGEVRTKLFHENRLLIEDAPEPKEIIYKNLSIKFWQNSSFFPVCDHDCLIYLCNTCVFRSHSTI